MDGRKWVLGRFVCARSDHERDTGPAITQFMGDEGRVPALPTGGPSLHRAGQNRPDAWRRANLARHHPTDPTRLPTLPETGYVDVIRRNPRGSAMCWPDGSHTSRSPAILMRFPRCFSMKESDMAHRQERQIVQPELNLRDFLP